MSIRKRREIYLEHAALMKANGQLKRELAALQAEYDKLEKLYQPMSCECQGLREENLRLKHTNGTRQEATRPACPDDCVRHANPGPGGSVCRNCVRNPHAVDKYTNGTYTPDKKDGDPHDG